MKNFKYNAWTMVELVISLSIIILLSTLIATNFKPVSQKARVFIYANMKNLGKATIGIVEEEDQVKIDNGCSGSSCNGVEDKYCAKVADLFSLSGTPDCEIETAKPYKLSMTLGNGSQLYGLTSEWKNYCYVDDNSCDAYYKDIMIDIDGGKGKNTMWIDRFPLRLYEGDGITGVYYPSNCGNKDIVYGETTSQNRQLMNPYCNGADNTDFLSNDTLITYDIYRADNDEEEMEKALPRKVLLPPGQADCAAYGGSGLFKAGYCLANKDTHKLIAECITSDHCENYDTLKDIIPTVVETESGNKTISNKASCNEVAAILNPKNLKCFTIIHKPSGGVNVLLDSAIGEIDM